MIQCDAANDSSMKMNVADHFLASWKIITVTLILLFMGEHLMCLEERCPVYNDIEWKTRDQKCDPTKKYHCFENEAGKVWADGCYVRKQCKKGAHPVVDNNHIRCDLCQEGYQPTPRLDSSSFTYSYCHAHRRDCDPQYGESLCYAGTKEKDVACTCNATLGFSAQVEGENCSCFTANGPCTGCKFIACPEGSSKTTRGFCEPDHTIVSSSSTTTTLKYLPNTSPPMPAPSDDNGNDVGLIIGLTFLLVIIILLIILIVLWKREILGLSKIFHATKCKPDRGELSESMIKRNGSSSNKSTNLDVLEITSEVERRPMISVQNGHPTYVQLRTHTANITMTSSNTSGPVTYVDYMDAEHVNFLGDDTRTQPSGTTEGGPSTPPRDPSVSGTSQGGPSTPPRDPSVSGTSQGGPSTPPRDPSVSGTSHGGPSTPPRDPSVSGTTQGGLSTPKNARHPSVSSSHPPPESPSLPQPSAPPESLPVPSAPPKSLPVPSAPPESLPVPSAPPESLPVPSAPPKSLPVPSAPPESLPVSLSSQLVADQSHDTEENNTSLNTSSTRDEGDQSGVGDSDETLPKSLNETVTCQSGHDDFDEVQRKELINEREAMNSEDMFPQRMTSGDGIHREAYKDVKRGASAYELVAVQTRSTAITPTTCDNESDFVVNCKVVA